MMAPSLASVPPVEKNDFFRSPGVTSARSLPSRALGSVAHWELTLGSRAACEAMAAFTRSSQCPRLVKTNWEVKSRYFRPSLL